MKVCVTGAGIISAIGVGVRATRLALLQGKSGVGSISHLATQHDELPVGEVAMTNGEMARMLNVGSPANKLRTVLLGIIAAKEAVSTARLSAEQLRVAAFINGTTVGGMDNTERHFGRILATNGDCPESSEMQYNDCGSATMQIAEQIGDFKFVTTTSTACSSAANAIIFGANLIKSGMVDVAVVGGSEALTRFHLNGFNTLMILDHAICRPFDKERNGINLGEGAAYLVLESENSARCRGARVMATLRGYGNACDAHHQTATSDNGEGPYLSMSKALDMANLQPSDIDYINAHGTGTPNNDLTEFCAMQRIWGEQMPPFSSTKPFTGHTTSAAGSIEAVICLLSLAHGFLPANMGFNTPLAQGCMPLAHVRQDVNINNVLTNSFGFGGNDSTLIFSKWLDYGG